MFKISYDLTNGMLRRSPKSGVGGVRLGSTREYLPSSGVSKRLASGASGWETTSSGGSNYGPAGMGLDQRYSPVFDRAEVPTLGQQFLPADTAGQNKLFKEIATFDPIIGATIEYWKDLAFSERVILSGIEDNDEVLQHYNDAIESSRIIPLMPELLHDFLVMGRIVVHMIYDAKKGYWTDSISHDQDFLSIQLAPSPNLDPLIDLQPTAEMRKWAASKDPRVIEQRRTLDQAYVKMMAGGKKIPLPPEHTIFLPRKVFSYDRIGMSFLTRVLIFKIYEAAVFNASVAGARRGAGPLFHITAWEDATDDELRELTDMFFAAEEDPAGAKVVTKSGVTVNAITQGPANYWKLSEEWGFLTEGKMRALGISEQFLSGEANWNSMETIRSVFLEKVQTQRSFFTKRILLDRIIKPIAREQNYVKRTKAELSHKIRVGAKAKSDSELLLPIIEWDRPLMPTKDQEYLELLATLKEYGVPIDTRMLSQAAGYDIDKVLEGFGGELELRKKIYTFNRSLAKLQKEMGVSAEGVFEGGGEAGAGTDLDFGGGGGGGGFDLGPGGGEEPAIPEAPAAEPPAGGGGEEPAAGPGGAGASTKGRFKNKKKSPQKLVTASPEEVGAKFKIGGGNILELLEPLPLWDENDALFAMPRRHYAKLIHESSKSDPSWRSRKKLMEDLSQSLRKQGLSQVQVEAFLYLGMRIGYFPPTKLSQEMFDVLAKVASSKINGHGLTRAISNELIAISRLNGEERTASKTLRTDLIRMLPMAEKKLPHSQMLTGKINPKEDLLPEKGKVV